MHRGGAAAILRSLLLAVGVVRPTLALQPSARLPTVVAAPHSSARATTTRLQEGGGFFQKLADEVGKQGKRLADSALAEFEKQASIAAMQDQDDPNRLGGDRVPRTDNLNLPEARPLPDSFEDSINLAVDAVAECVAEGTTKIVVEFDTSAGDETYNLNSRTLKFVQPFLCPFADEVAPDFDEPPADAADGGADADERPPRMQLLFADEGTAAYVRNNWGASVPARTRCQSMQRAQLAVGTEVLLLVCPQATEVPAVQRLIDQVDEKAPGTLVVLVNPKLVDMQSTGYGLVGRELRDMVTNSFASAFALKSYAAGALYRVYPGGWSVWRENGLAAGGYELAYSSSRRPSGDEVEELLAGDDGDDGGGGGLAAFIKGFQAL